MPKLRRLRGNIASLHLRYYVGKAGTRRNAGRMDGLEYAASWFISPADVDGRYDDPENDISEEVVEDTLTFERCHNSRPFVVSLLEIARPAKVKGLAKEFEVVDAPRRVIALEDEDEIREWVDDEDWEEIYHDEEPYNKKGTYSSVLRAHDM